MITISVGAQLRRPGRRGAQRCRSRFSRVSQGTVAFPPSVLYPGGEESIRLHRSGTGEPLLATLPPRLPPTPHFKTFVPSLTRAGTPASLLSGRRRATLPFSALTGIPKSASPRPPSAAGAPRPAHPATTSPRRRGNLSELAQGGALSHAPAILSQHGRRALPCGPAQGTGGRCLSHLMAKCMSQTARRAPCGPAGAQGVAGV
jgi:hypothetical protein